ncbi:uncharacterized protein MONBRDRAFT_8069 [Monosiga brevicollis MX1]|uniref:Uncharacterized protein n=1 Tax=Monosiga brevicollis TaxID=81824 RepID=A9UYY6_MONBE|nr:uncharacterized protein MONBRDRAFT_8069 [Monosiga brevicollis MX1]EDQ89541.1 predicted protein [Monosiga brevicollis MX1]|eukprot:XP_001745570.1 hypothetical protein [Monosiga brevicollis MX1]
MSKSYVVIKLAGGGSTDSPVYKGPGLVAELWAQQIHGLTEPGQGLCRATQMHQIHGNVQALGQLSISRVLLCDQQINKHSNMREGVHQQQQENRWCCASSSLMPPHPTRTIRRRLELSVHQTDRFPQATDMALPPVFPTRGAQISDHQRRGPLRLIHNNTEAGTPPGKGSHGTPKARVAMTPRSTVRRRYRRNRMFFEAHAQHATPRPSAPTHRSHALAEASASDSEYSSAASQTPQASTTGGPRIANAGQRTAMLLQTPVSAVGTGVPSSTLSACSDASSIASLDTSSHSRALASPALSMGSHGPSWPSITTEDVDVWEDVDELLEQPHLDKDGKRTAVESGVSSAASSAPSSAISHHRKGRRVLRAKSWPLLKHPDDERLGLHLEHGAKRLGRQHAIGS